MGNRDHAWEKVNVLRGFLGLVAALCVLSLGVALLLGQGAPILAQAPAEGVRPSDAVAVVTFNPAVSSLSVGEAVTLTIHVDYALNLYGVQYRVHFDPSRLEVLDANTGKPGVQIGSATMFAGQPTLEAYNQADNVTGVITYGLSIYNGQAVNGSGDLGAIRFRAKGNGLGQVQFDENTAWTALANPNGLPISSTWHSAVVAIDAYQLYLPLIMGPEGQE